jgi:hypothetical protein
MTKLLKRAHPGTIVGVIVVTVVVCLILISFIF